MSDPRTTADRCVSPRPLSRLPLFPFLKPVALVSQVENATERTSREAVAAAALNTLALLLKFPGPAASVRVASMPHWLHARLMADIRSEDQSATQASSRHFKPKAACQTPAGIPYAVGGPGRVWTFCFRS